MVSYSVFFTQNSLPFKPNDVYNMEVDDFIIYYDIIIRQLDEKRKAFDG